MRSFLKTAQWPRALILALAVAGAAPAEGRANVISPGFDFFETESAEINLKHIDPALGIVPFVGAPGGPGTTDTIVERLAGLPSGGTGTIQVEIVALSLRSVSPVTISGTDFNVFVELKPDLFFRSFGEYDVKTHGATGGIYNSFFGVFTRATLTEVGNPSNTNGFELPFSTIERNNSVWSHTPPPGYPTSAGTGNFFPTALIYRLNTALSGREAPLVSLNLRPARTTLPEPAALAVFGLGLAGLALMRRRRAA